MKKDVADRITKIVTEFDSREGGLLIPFSIFAGDTQITCPLCNHECVHHKEMASVVLSADDYSASNRVRGSVICIPMNCEASCEFILCIGFHKGSTYFWAIPCADGELND